jgi:class 3 adenylate cyclase
LSGVVQKEALLSLLFARLIENYASPELFNDVTRYFKGNKYITGSDLAKNIQRALRGASEEEKNQFKACLALFNPNKKADQLKTLSMLSNVDLGRPFLQRRLNRFVRLAGLLGIKTATKNIAKILEFARMERIAYLEETCIVSLCQLYDKVTLDRAGTLFVRPLENVPSLKGYIRGLRFCIPPLYIKELAELLLKPEVPIQIKLRVLETFDQFNLKQARGVVPVLIKALLLPTHEPQLRSRLEKHICQWGEANIFQVMIGFLNSRDRAIRIHAIRVLRELALKDTMVPREVLVNRYYLLLEEEDKEIKQEALIALLYLKDDYAIQVFGDYFKDENRSEVPVLLERLPRPLNHEVVRFLFKQISIDDSALQNTLRTILLEVAKSDYAEELRNVLLEYMNHQLGKVIMLSPANTTEQNAGLLEQAKVEFKFKRENAQILTVFFCDIVSYTEKTSMVNASTLMTLIRSFEGIVFPVIRELRGQIVKTLGDGILAAFKHPLNAVLAALSVQKKVREYNQFKVDEEKFFLRIGLNTGQVLRKQNDIFGDVVNIASRMQAAANPGDILLTHDTFIEIQNYLKCSPLGKIKVKGKEEAIAAYAAQEIKVDFNHLLKTAGSGTAVIKKAGTVDPITNLKESMFTPSYSIPPDISQGRGLLREIERLFQGVTAAVEEIAKDYHEEYEFKKYLQKRWEILVKHWDQHLVAPEENPSRAVSS